jgi:hypothetical protein
MFRDDMLVVRKKTGYFSLVNHPVFIAKAECIAIPVFLEEGEVTIIMRKYMF